VPKALHIVKIQTGKVCIYNVPRWCMF